MSEIDPVANLRAEDFEAQVGRKFRFVVNEGQLELDGEILRVRRLQQHGPDTGRTPFAVELGTTGTKYFQQGTVRFENEAIGALELFAVALGPQPGGMLYEVIFT